MPYARSTPEQLAFVKEKSREYNRRYRESAKGKAVRKAANLRWIDSNRDRLNEARRGGCEICGGPKEPGRGFRKCNECWGVRPEQTLDELIADQADDMYLDRLGVVRPQRFGDRSDPQSGVLPLDWRDDIPEEGEWSDPTADEALDSASS